MTRTAAACQELFEAIAPVLPGRVAPLPPSQAPYPPPYVWIGKPDRDRQTFGQSTQLTVATFPIWVSYDGAVKAQVAGSYDLVDKVWDATLTVAAARPLSASPQIIDVAGHTVSGDVVLVEVTLGALTLCIPEVEESPIPPEPVEV